MRLETLITMLDLVRGYAAKIEAEYPETAQELYHDANKAAFTVNSYGYPDNHVKACLAIIKTHMEAE